ncbi:hypothetical protein C8R45DRAFT_923116 [Mycena sanguinolenta]|nr:hypothetical protein C8R45DRAFT_923116 [Mycena sanguinolenta]
MSIEDGDYGFWAHWHARVERGPESTQERSCTGQSIHRRKQREMTGMKSTLVLIESNEIEESRQGRNGEKVCAKKTKMRRKVRHKATSSMTERAKQQRRRQEHSPREQRLMVMKWPTTEYRGGTKRQARRAESSDENRRKEVEDEPRLIDTATLPNSHCREKSQSDQMPQNTRSECPQALRSTALGSSVVPQLGQLPSGSCLDCLLQVPTTGELNNIPNKKQLDDFKNTIVILRDKSAQHQKKTSTKLTGYMLAGDSHTEQE